MIVVRRVADVTDGVTEPTLHFALDQHQRGTVEVADVGPLPVDDLRMSGESRVIRARQGYRPTIRITRTRTVASREQTAFLPLDRKSLTLEGLDLIVDAREMSGRQTALFGCAGANLVLRDCTVTVFNPTAAPFVLIRQEPSSRPSRIRLERTLVQGAFAAMAELTGGPADLVVDGTSILGGMGPVVRLPRPDAGVGVADLFRRQLDRESGANRPVRRPRARAGGSLGSCLNSLLRIGPRPAAGTRHRQRGLFIGRLGVGRGAG